MTIRPTPARITRIIARLNIGGPAIQAITLTHELGPRGFETRLIRGVESPAEGNMDHLAAELGVTPTLVSNLRRDPTPRDLVALAQLAWMVRRDRPAIVHTHAAKGGTLGRLATLLAFPRRRGRPVIVHTFHGHSLTGYFSGRTAAFYRLVERLLAPCTDVLVAVSEEVKQDLVEIGVAPASKFRVVPLGFDLTPFTDDANREAERASIRREWGVPEDTAVVTLIARLVPIKRVDRFLDAANRLSARTGVRFVIVGDGDLRDQLTGSDAARALGDQVVWTGFRRDVAPICFASDVVVLSSDNEGTPVSLIEAQAAAVPVVATDVGGVRSVVRDGVSGLLVGADDIDALSHAIASLLGDRERRARMGAAGRAHVTTAYTLARLVDDHANLYEELLATRPIPTGRWANGSRREPRA